jgi:hypothetical protein
MMADDVAAFRKSIPELENLRPANSTSIRLVVAVFFP